MHIHCELVILILALTLNDQVHTGKIIGGHIAGENSRPYMVLVERKMPAKTKHCGGFLLSEDFVMTAAHCVASSFRVYVGLHNYHQKDNAQIIPVEKTFPHEDFDEGTFRNDFMLLKLKSEAKLGGKVATIPLAELGDNPSKSCIVSGWGRNDTDSRMSPVLKEVSVTLTDKAPCDNDYFYCSDGKNGPAEGDSGGPLVCDEKAYGVVSHYEGHGNIPDTRFYAKIPKVRKWIDSVMKSN
ncbi:granzyme B(G,H)-like [Sphaeramia orbicularis]|uniref:trypsin n=1 Tax=Sphaeramia orbicularis TaxID=375764 RepID=A0A672YWR9_9TELE|nr:granzyme B(G,H)-like [Sphaeramia orbicularis]